MKGKRIAVLALAAAMTVSLLVLPAGAVSFTDIGRINMAQPVVGGNFAGNIKD